MDEKLSIKVKIALAGLLIVLIISIVGYILYVFFGDRGDTGDTDAIPTPVPVSQKGSEIVEVDPHYTVLLLPGEMQTFVVNFAELIGEREFDVYLTKHKFGAPARELTEVRFRTEAPSQGRNLFVYMEEEIEIYHEYSLTVTDEQGETLVSYTYLTATVEAPETVENNPELRQYLPYETESYILSYNERRGVYIFNFKVNPESSTPFQEQYEQAKQEAEAFIQSRGIDLESIVIEWRHS